MDGWRNSSCRSASSLPTICRATRWARCRRMCSAGPIRSCTRRLRLDPRFDASTKSCTGEPKLFPDGLKHAARLLGRSACAAALRPRAIRCYLQFAHKFVINRYVPQPTSLITFDGERRKAGRAPSVSINSKPCETSRGFVFWLRAGELLSQPNINHTARGCRESLTLDEHDSDDRSQQLV